jgi:hypothetical protein
MILFINVYITEESLTPNSQNRQNAKYSDKLDVFKYSLASLSNFYPWKKVIIYYKLDQHYIDRDQELVDFINEEFGEFDLSVRNSRNELQSQWQETYDLFDDNLIFYSCNHDHVMTESDPSYFFNLTEEFKDSEEHIAILYSHWQETISHPWQNVYHYPTYNVNITDSHLSYDVFDIASVYIITKKLYHHWWFTYNLPNIVFTRPDNFYNPIWHYGQFSNVKFIVPYREPGRHFDGYQHCGWKFTNNVCPVLEIPDGFFKNDIKINYSTKYIDGMTNIDPTNNELKIFSDQGTDYNYHKDFIPLFWKKRIKSFNDDFDLASDEENRNIYVNRVVRTWDGLPCTDTNMALDILNKVYQAYK